MQGHQFVDCHHSIHVQLRTLDLALCIYQLVESNAFMDGNVPVKFYTCPHDTPHLLSNIN